MAPIAALYDIHGNAPALRAVLADVALIPNARIVVGGDIAWGPMPEDTLAIVRSMERTTVIRGNADREVADLPGARDGLDPFTAAVTRACGEAIGPDGRAYLGTLSPAASLRLGARRDDDRELGEFAADPRVAATRVLPREAQDRRARTASTGGRPGPRWGCRQRRGTRSLVPAK